MRVTPAWFFADTVAHMPPMDTAPGLPTGLTLAPGLKPFEIKKLITERVNAMVPLDKHVVVVTVMTEDGLRFAAAQRLGGHLELFQGVSFKHGSTGKAWSGEVGVKWEF